MIMIVKQWKVKIKPWIKYESQHYTIVCLTMLYAYHGLTVVNSHEFISLGLPLINDDLSKIPSWRQSIHCS